MIQLNLSEEKYFGFWRSHRGDRCGHELAPLQCERGLQSFKQLLRTGEAVDE